MLKPSILAATLLAAAAASPALADPPPSGQSLYMENCSACHQPNGMGRKGSFPALAGDAFVKGDPNAVIATVLNGRGGMPTFKADLDDTQLAAILTYVRGSWGNTGKPVLPAQIAAIRAKGTTAKTQGFLAH
jgi:cytochrome c6